MTDYFCHQAQLQNKSCLNILTNGGAQRGHTVVHDRLRHVFHHFGSGYFSNAFTYFSKFYVINPIIYQTEKSELIELYGVAPVVYAHPDCKISTPYDMVYNKIILENNNQHNSCGIGVWHTLDRYKDNIGNITIKDYKHLCSIYPESSVKKEIILYLKKVRDYYLDKLYEQGINISDDWREIIFSVNLMLHFVEDLKVLNDICIGCNKGFFNHFDTIVFENAQGLLLDMSDDKYGTCSHTGHEYIDEMLKDIISEGDELELCYVTRSYLTRHGDGDFPEECNKEEISPKINDTTNVYNDCQGHLRYAKLDVDSLMDRIHKDANKVKYNHKVSLAVTHLDEYEIDIDADYESYSPDSLKIKKVK